MVVAFAAVVVRLGIVQGVSADRYAAVGESQRLRTVELPGERGSILDRNGHELAMSVRRPTLWANPRLVVEASSTASALAPLLKRSVADLRADLSRDAAFVYLARKVEPGVAERVKALNLPGVFTVDESARMLPAADLAASTVGKAGLDNNGLTGLELQYEEVLAGKPGHMVVERAQGNDITGGLREHTPSEPGDDLVLTIDRSLQYETERALSDAVVTHSAEGGMAVVMDTDSGDILAMANLEVPAGGGPPVPTMNNEALTTVYEPGSVNKLITMTAALEERVTQATDQLVVPDTIEVAGSRFEDHEPHPTEPWSMTRVMAESSNVASIMLGQQLGKERLDRYLRDFGFGTRTGIGYPGESAGLLLPTEKWSGTTIATVPTGYGMAVTAVQMLAAYNTIANGGQYVAPTLVRAVIGPDGRQQPTPPAARRQVVSPATAQQVTGMLTEVVKAGTGTSAAIDGYTVAGKTGTARKPKEGERGYEQGAYMSSFAGFVPSESPALTAIVILDEPEPIYGGIVAAPVFAELARYGLRQFSIPPPPDGPAAPVPTLEKALADGDVPPEARTTTPGQPSAGTPSTTGSTATTRPTGSTRSTTTDRSTTTTTARSTTTSRSEATRPTGTTRPPQGGRSTASTNP